jgi:hypothetical protein
LASYNSTRNCRQHRWCVAASFDTIGQEWLIRFLEHRIGDRRIIRLIQKMAEGGRPGGRGRCSQ